MRMSHSDANVALWCKCRTLIRMLHSDANVALWCKCRTLMRMSHSDANVALWCKCRTLMRILCWKKKRFMYVHLVFVCSSFVLSVHNGVCVSELYLHSHMHVLILLHCPRTSNQQRWLWDLHASAPSQVPCNKKHLSWWWLCSRDACRDGDSALVTPVVMVALLVWRLSWWRLGLI